MASPQLTPALHVEFPLDHPADTLERAARAGFRAIHLKWLDHQASKASFEQAAAAVRGANLEIAGYGPRWPPGPSLVSASKDRRFQARAWLLAALDQARW